MLDPAGERVYTNAEKIINVHKELPVGMVAYGLGGIGGRSVTSLAKDLRDFLTYPPQDRGSYHLNPATYTVEEVAGAVRLYFYEELYQTQIVPLVRQIRETAEADTPPIAFPIMGFIVAGMSAGEAKSEVWSVEVDQEGNCESPQLLWGMDTDGVIVWRGVQEPLVRLLIGTTAETWQAVKDQGLSDEEARALLYRWAPLAEGAMPIQDAIDLVAYLASVVAGYLRFSAGPDFVAPPIDIAAITKHERFKWVRRKHYFPAELNPE